MPTSRAELKGRVSLNSTAFQRNLRKIRRRVRMWGRSMKRVGAVAARSMAVATAAIGVATVAMLKLVKATAKQGDEFDKMSLRTGISSQTLSEYAHAANITGTSQQTLQKGLKTFARSVTFAKDGLMTYIREFDRLGISMDDLNGKSPQEAFEMTLGALNGLDDELAKSAAAQGIFGRAGQELIPLSKLGAEGIANLRKEARELGITFDQESATKAARFNDELTRLKGAFAGVRNKLVLAFLDQFSDGIAKIVKKIVEFRKEGKFTTWAAQSAQAVNNFVENARVLLSNLRNYSKATFEVIKLAGIIAWQSIALAANEAGKKMAKAINFSMAAARSATNDWKTEALIAWNLIKGTFKLAMMSLEAVGKGAFYALGAAAEISINGIIKGLNKIPGIDISPAKFDWLDKIEKDMAALKPKMNKELENLKIGGDAWKPLEEGVKQTARIRKEQKAINAELEKQFKANEKIADSLAKNIELYNSGEAFATAIKNTEEETVKIKGEHEKIAKSIDNWQTRALDKERERKKNTEETLENLAGQNAELSKMSGGPLRGLFRRLPSGVREPGAPGQRGDSIARAKFEQEKRIQQEQLKIQQQIATNTGKKREALAW